jgi:hypothetical protein
VSECENMSVMALENVMFIFFTLSLHSFSSFFHIREQG